MHATLLHEAMELAVHRDARVRGYGVELARKILSKNPSAETMLWTWKPRDPPPLSAARDIKTDNTTNR
jgi:hypothetical protein